MTETTLQTFIRLLRQTQFAQDKVDSFDLHSEDDISVSNFEDLCREANYESAMLIGFVHTHARELMDAIVEDS